MTRIVKSSSWALAALALVAGRGAAQVTLPSDNTAYGTTSAEFLLLGASARGMSLGGAYAALATDVSALYYNPAGDRKSTRLNSSHQIISYAVFCLKKNKIQLPLLDEPSRAPSDAIALHT